MGTVDALGPVVTARDSRRLPSPSHAAPRHATLVPLRVVGGSRDAPSCPHADNGACGNAPRKPTIDDTDAQLLRMLQADGRVANARLAEAVGLSQAAVHDRVRRLTRDGFILGYRAVLNPALLETGMLVFAEVRVEGAGPSIGDAFRAAVHVRSEILECHQVAGSFDYLIKTRVSDISVYRDLVASVIWTLPGVRDVRTYAVIDEVKQTTRFVF